MRLYVEMGIEPEGLTKFSMINPIEFKETRTILEDLGEWLQGPTFQEPPALARREDLFRRRVEAIDDEYGWLILELIAAHCQSPGDAANRVFVFADFQAICRDEGARTSESSFNSRLSKLIESGLVHQSFDKPKTGTTRLYIEKQWWDLTLEELRNRARIKKTD
ncbi:MAG TPA: hypothetical protein VIE89_35990 [Candidatus Binatia bacterium]